MKDENVEFRAFFFKKQKDERESLICILDKITVNGWLNNFQFLMDEHISLFGPHMSSVGWLSSMW